jgi:hypothetical protein
VNLLSFHPLTEVKTSQGIACLLQIQYVKAGGDSAKRMGLQNRAGGMSLMRGEMQVALGMPLLVQDHAWVQSTDLFQDSAVGFPV